ncbi:TPA: oligosaccharide flippase family protein, partial [Citrobacter freundii]|nr:oligosaccharide flippase family protein [Citrobacter freundii]
MIIKTAFWAMSQTLVKLIAGFIIIKFIAKVGGPDALSNFGLYQNLVTVLLMVSGGVMFAGVTSKISRAENNEEFTRFYLGANLFLNRLLLLSVFAFFSLCVYIIYVSADRVKGNIITLLIISLPFLLLQTRFNFYLAILNGLSKVNLLARDNIYASFLTILIACVAFFITTDWRYFAICMCLGPALRYLYIIGRKKQEYKLSGNIKPDKNLHYLLRYSLVGLVSSLCLPIAQIIARNFITNHSGTFESGIWQGLTRFSEVYLVLVSSVLSVYVLPKISPAKSRKQIKECILPLIMLLIPLICIGVV